MDKMHRVVLVVEDEEAHVELLQRAFHSAPGDYLLLVAHSIAEARQYLSNLSPNILLTDYDLPDGSGLQLIADRSETAPFPCVVMTSHHREEVANEAIKKGVFAYFIKSKDLFKEMPHSIHRALQEWEQIMESREARETLRAGEYFFRKNDFDSPLKMALEKVRGRVLVEANLSFQVMLGVSEEDLLNKTLADLVHPDDRAKDQVQYGDLIGGRCDIYQVEKRFIHKDGDTIPATITVSLIRDYRGWPKYVMNVVEDYPFRKDTEADLARARRLADGMTYFKSTFNTPISKAFHSQIPSLIGIVEIQKEDHDRNSEMLEGVDPKKKRTIETLDVMIGQKQLKRITFDKKPTFLNLIEETKTTIGRIQDDLKIQNVNIRLLGTKKQIRYKMDRAMFHFILKSLLVDALQYNSVGDITLCFCHSDTTIRVIVCDACIANNGDCPLYDEKSRQDSPVTKCKLGTEGIRLSFANKLVDLMEGKSKIKRVEGQTVNSFVLISKASSVNVHSENEIWTTLSEITKNRQASKRQRLLLIEGNPHIMKYARAEYRDQYDVDGAANEIEGLFLIRHRRYDLVLLNSTFAQESEKDPIDRETYHDSRISMFNHTYIKLSHSEADVILRVIRKTLRQSSAA